MRHVVDKARATGNDQVLVCERGTSFGYNYLISNMRALAILRETGCPVVFDATHSHADAERAGHSSGAEREFLPVLARAAMAVGIAGIFMETQPRPDEALSDGPNAWPLPEMEALLETLQAIDLAVKAHSDPNQLGRPSRHAGLRGGRLHRIAHRP
jgi:2-dehydro-3-deoxyphosphooctonate aldolase (KDO 8-P synthase)